MDKGEYIFKLAEYFTNCRTEDFDDETRHQVRRCLIDYLGCAAFSGANNCCKEWVELIKGLKFGQGEAKIWGEENKVSPMCAAFANAVRVSSIEMDDCSGIGASVHPGIYVMSTVLAMTDETTKEETFYRAVIGGYDICMRMGLLATEQVRELGLHGPGLAGGMAGAVAAGIMKGLSVQQLYYAMCITASLLPLCPFTTFMEGADAKDLYGGWGVFLGMFAAEAAARNLTGPKHILEGEKSLSWLFAGTKGFSWEPGEHFYINDVSFKKFSACHSVHPAMTAIQELLGKFPVDPKAIRKVTVSTYPYSYALNEGVKEPLNASSARLSLAFTTAVALLEGDLKPTAFLPDGLTDERYLAMSKKIQVTKNEDYQDGPFGIRGTKIRIEMEDGTVYEDEVTKNKWDQAPGDKELAEKFFGLAKGNLEESQARHLRSLILEKPELNLKEVLEAVCTI